MAGNVGEAGGWRRGRLRIAMWALLAFVLALPGVAMQFTKEVQWGPLDFAVAGVLLAALGVGMEVAMRQSGNAAYRLGACVAIGTCFLIVWAALAVGVIGIEGDPFDLAYLGVLAVGIAGTLMARFEAGGLALTSFAMAASVVLIAAVALMLGKAQEEFSSLEEIAGVHAMLLALFAVSGMLFLFSARQKQLPGRDRD